MRRIDFKDTDKKIEINIYGENFEINEEELEKIDTKEIRDDSDMEKMLNDVLGDGSIDEINKIRKENGYGKLTTQNGIAIFSAILSEYVENATKPFENVANSVDKFSNKMNGYQNRYQRRQRNRNNRYRRY